MPARLVVIAGPDQGKTFPLTAPERLLIGRGRDATVRLADPHASRNHCQVKLEAGGAVVADLDSASGIFVNDIRVRSRALHHGDLLRLGTTVLRFESDDLADQATLPPPPAKPAAPAAAPRPSGGPVPARAPAGARLGQNPGSGGAPSAPVPRPAVQPLANLSGQVVGHFHVGSVIAQGKSGIVFRAHDSRDKQDVALKVFFPELAQDEEELQRFLRAMKTILPLRHPHLVHVNSAGRTGAFCWVSMELVAGLGLNTAVKHAAGGADWQIAFRAVQHVARALAYLHGQHIIHRNITPTNILMATADGTIKLGDLITVKAQEGKLARQVTQAGELLGDVRFLSPEQTTSASAGDGRADLYSLGATAYALLTGRAPFEGRNAVETILQIRQNEPRPLRQLLPTIPPAFEATVMKLLARNPEHRFASPGELLGHLANIAKG
jgi:hypothetical protein